MFQKLVTKSNEGFKTVHAETVSEYQKDDGHDIDKNIYAFIDDQDKKKFEDSRLGEDKYGNNILHFIFFLPDMPKFNSLNATNTGLLEKDTSNCDLRTKIRNIFLKVAID